MSKIQNFAVNSPWKKRAKLALIPLLLIVLVCVFAFGMPPKPDSSSAPVEGAPTLKEKRPRGNSSTVVRPPAPEINLEELVDVNPFEAVSVGSQAVADRTPVSSAPASPTSLPVKSPALLSVVPAYRLQAIYSTHSGSVAIIDSQTVRPGDVLADGARVVSITPLEVLVDAK